MRRELLLYLIFTLLLIVAILLLPVFFLEDTIVVCLAVACIIRSIHRLSLFVLNVVVIAVTAVAPILILLWITKHPILSILKDFVPANSESLLRLVNLLLPTGVLNALVILIRKSVNNKQ